MVDYLKKLILIQRFVIDTIHVIKFWGLKFIFEYENSTGDILLLIKHLKQFFTTKKLWFPY